jgi:hypothetical protein
VRSTPSPPPPLSSCSTRRGHEEWKDIAAQEMPSPSAVSCNNDQDGRDVGSRMDQTTEIKKLMCTPSSSSYSYCFNI